MKPSVGRIVHYVSHGSPVQPDGSQMYTAKCRAAVISEVGPDADVVGLCVLNPTGMFFRTLAEGGCRRDDHDHSDRLGGSWHWPERVE